MIKTNANPGEIISLGICGENNARQIVFDISDWLDTYGPGTAYLVARRSGDVAPYPAVVEQDGSSVTWTLTSADTGKSGHGQAELVYTIGGTIVKSRVWDTYTADALTDNTETPPEPASGWVEQVLAAGAQAVDAAEAAEQAASRAESAVPSGSLEIGSGLVWNGKKLEVDTADNVEQDNTKPITSAAVYTEIGNIEALLAAI